MSKSYYDILGVTSHATQEEIKRAYRRLVKKHHPDVNPEATGKTIRKIYEAYEVLSDSSKRSRYDRTGSSADLTHLYAVWKAKKEAVRRHKEQVDRQKEEFIRKKKVEKEANERMIRNIAFYLFSGLFIMLVTGLSWQYFKIWQENRELSRYGEYTTGMVYEFTSGLISASDAFYRYQVSGVEYSGRSRLAITFAQMPLSTTGMPVLHGDEFLVFYSRRNPSVSQLILNEPTERQMKRYREKSVGICANFIGVHIFSTEPDYPTMRAFCECLVQKVYNDKGIPGMADIYFMNTEYLENIRHNQYTFERLIEKPFFQKARQACANEAY